MVIYASIIALIIVTICIFLNSYSFKVKQIFSFIDFSFKVNSDSRTRRYYRFCDTAITKATAPSEYLESVLFLTL